MNVDRPAPRLRPPRTLGVLGGMGPLATAFFFTKLVELTPADDDQEHIPTLIWSCPQIPDRIGPILRREGAVSPLPLAAAGARKLEAGGAQAIAMPCNTIHYWLRELREAVTVPVLSIIDATLDSLPDIPSGNGRIGIIATAGTLRAELYQPMLRERGMEPVLPGDDDMNSLVLPAIAAVKRNRLEEARAGFTTAVEGLNARDVEAIILACTEVPVALGTQAPPGWPCWVDTLEALAGAAVRWCLAAEAAVAR